MDGMMRLHFHGRFPYTSHANTCPLTSGIGLRWFEHWIGFKEIFTGNLYSSLKEHKLFFSRFSVKPIHEVRRVGWGCMGLVPVPKDMTGKPYDSYTIACTGKDWPLGFGDGLLLGELQVGPRGLILKTTNVVNRGEVACPVKF